MGTCPPGRAGGDRAERAPLRRVAGAGSAPRLRHQRPGDPTDPETEFGDPFRDGAQTLGDHSLFAVGMVFDSVDLTFEFRNRLDSLADGNAVASGTVIIGLIYVESCAVIENVVEVSGKEWTLVGEVAVGVTVLCESTTHDNFPV